MTDETSYQKARLSRESHAEEAEKMTLWTEELERIDHCEVYEHENKLIDNKILDSYVTHEEPSGGPTGDYMTP